MGDYFAVSGITGNRLLSKCCSDCVKLSQVEITCNIPLPIAPPKFLLYSLECCTCGKLAEVYDAADIAAGAP